jgi:hypothetical protein
VEVGAEEAVDEGAGDGTLGEDEGFEGVGVLGGLRVRKGNRVSTEKCGVGW